MIYTLLYEITVTLALVRNSLAKIFRYASRGMTSSCSCKCLYMTVVGFDGILIKLVWIQLSYMALGVVLMFLENFETLPSVIWSTIHGYVNVGVGGTGFFVRTWWITLIQTTFYLFLSKCFCCCQIWSTDCFPRKAPLDGSCWVYTLSFKAILKLKITVTTLNYT